MSRFGLDYSWSAPIAPAHHKAVGSSFACRYLNGSGTKAITRAEASALQNGGIAVVGVYETTAKRALNGRAAGVADANAAVNLARAAGKPEGRPIYFAVDFDATLADQPAIAEYFRGVGDVLNNLGPAGMPHQSAVGVYGGYWPCKRLADAGLVGYIWQTAAWSGRNLLSRANIYQFSFAHSVAGHSVDYDRALKADFGQWGFAAPKPKPVAEPKGQWFFKGHVDMDDGSWHIQPQPGKNVHTGGHDRWWAADLEVNEKHGLWRIKGKPFVS